MKPFRLNRSQFMPKMAAKGGLVALAGALLLGAVNSAMAANVASVSAAPSPFTPATCSTGGSTISYSLTNNALLWLRIYDLSSVLKRNLVTPTSFTATNKAAGANSSIWYGCNDASVIQANGQYPYKIDNVFWSASIAVGGTSAQDVVINPTTPATLWAIDKTSPYMWKSTDGGTNWTGISGTGADLKAYGLAISDDGTKIFLADYAQSALRISTNSGTNWAASGAFPGSSTSVTDVAVSGDGLTVYAIDPGLNKIYKSTNSGTSWTTCAATGLALGAATSGSGIATNSAGTTLIAVDSANNRVYKSTDSCATFSQLTAITAGTAAGQVTLPYDAEIQSDGKFWISEVTNHRIQQFDSSGNVLMTVGGTASGTGNLQFNSGAKYFGIGLVTDASQPYVFVADYSNGVIKKLGYDNWASSTHVEIGAGINTTTVGAASATSASTTSIQASMPYVDDSNVNNTYTVDYKLSSSGTWTNWVTAAAHSASPYTTTITGLTAGSTYDVRMTYNDADGVTGTNPQTVSNITLPTGASNVGAITVTPNPFNANNAETTTIGYNLTSAALVWVKVTNMIGNSVRKLVTPASFTATNKAAGANSSLWDGKNESAVIQPDGQYPLKINDAFFTQHIASPGTNTFDIAVNPANTAIMWLIDKTSPYVFKSTNGGAAWTGVSGTGASAKAQGIAISADGQKIYIAVDTSANLKMSTNGGSTWTTSASLPAGATSVVDVAVSDDGNIVYALDFTNKKIYRSANAGTSWSTCAAGSLTLGAAASGIATSANGTVVLVTDSSNNDIYRSDDSCGFFFGYGMTAGTAAGNLSFPYQIALESNGNFWVSERDNHRIQQFDANANVLMTIGGTASGTGNYQFNSGATMLGIGLAKLSDQTSVLIADYNNTRIKIIGYDNWASTTHISIASAPPNAPTALSAGDTPADQGGSITLNWTVSTSTTPAITAQRIYRSTTSGSGYTLLATISNNTTATYVDATAVTGTSYYYVIRAYNGAQESANSNQATAIAVDNIAPNAPTALAATPGNAQVSLAWTLSSSTDVTAQRVYRSITSGSGYTLLASVSSTATLYLDTTAVNSTTYYYVIRAFDGTQESANSVQASATPLSSLVNAPTNLAATEGDAQVGLTWTPSNTGSVTTQRVYRSTTSGSGYALVTSFANNTTASYTDTSVTNTTTYYYVIRAFNGTTESGNSNEVSARPSSNTAPVASNGVLYPLKNNTAYGTLIATDVDNDTLTYTLLSVPALGVVTITNATTGAYQYVPNLNATGTDSFTFRVDDGRVNSNTATISVNISGPVTGTTLAAGINYWHMVSIPTHLTQKNDWYSLMVDDLGFSPIVYGAIPNGAGSWVASYLPAATAQPGKAYWMVINAPSSVTIDDQYNGENMAECNSTDFPGVQCVDVTLLPGANMIGNPYAATKNLLNTAHVKVCNSTTTGGCHAAGNWVSFSTAVTNGWLLNTIYRYNPVTKIYDNVKSVADGTMNIAPWEGWWLRSDTANTVILRFYR